MYIATSQIITFTKLYKISKVYIIEHQSKICSDLLLVEDNFKPKLLSKL